MSSIRYNRYIRTLLLIALTLVPLHSFAHVEEAATGFMSGLKHPVFGFDHLLAMVSVGIISSQLGGVNIWRIPSAFVLAMIFGGIVGAHQISLPYGELGIAMSVILLGSGIIFSNKNTPALLVTICVIFFGFFHGHAHGLEMPKTAEPAYYTFGFVISTSALHVLGVIIGEISIRRTQLLKVLRYGGVGMAVCGVFFLLQALGTI
jgi:urease accessory protein